MGDPAGCRWSQRVEVARPESFRRGRNLEDRHPLRSWEVRPRVHRRAKPDCYPSGVGCRLSAPAAQEGNTCREGLAGSPRFRARTGGLLHRGRRVLNRLRAGTRGKRFGPRISESPVTQAVVFLDQAWQEWQGPTFARVRPRSLARTNTLETACFGRTPANARSLMPCRKSWVSHVMCSCRHERLAVSMRSHFRRRPARV
jgi:hypothetical protein